MTTETKTLTAAVAKALGTLREFARTAGEAARKSDSAAKALVRAAIQSGTDETSRFEGFKAATEALYNEIRANSHGLARSVGAVRNDAGDAYVIPNSIKAQVSQVLRALRFGVDLGTEKEPIGITAMRKAAAEKAEAAAEAERAKNPPAPLTGDDLIRDRVSNALKDAADAVKGLEGPALALAARAVADMAIRLQTIRTGHKPDVTTVPKEGEAASAVASEAATEAKTASPPADAVNPQTGKVAKVTVKGSKPAKKAARRIAKSA